MQIPFYKYQGTGNDFIIIDNREKKISLSTDKIALLCNRRFGIGADGLMLLENAEGSDFHMVYYNSDGNESSMCGNGGRCMVAFAKRLGLITSNARFTAIDGEHTASINEDGTISLHMNDVSSIEHSDGYCILDTGSPHYVLFVPDAAAENVVDMGRAIRNEERFQPKGINVNFVELCQDGLYVRTYERGVEDETLSCGTGVTAAAIASSGSLTGSFNISIGTPGGILKVTFEKDEVNAARNVVLTGPAVGVFEGKVNL